MFQSNWNQTKLFGDRQSTAKRMCVFGRSRKAEMLSRTRWYKNCHNFSSLQFFNSKLDTMLCISYSNRFCDFYIFPIVGIGAINFKSKKTGNPPLFSGVFSLQRKWKNDLISIFINYTIWLMFLCRIYFYHARFSIQSLLKQRLAHSSASAKTTYRRSSIRQQPQVYRGPAVDVLSNFELTFSVWTASRVNQRQPICSLSFISLLRSLVCLTFVVVEKLISTRKA